MSCFSSSDVVLLLVLFGPLRRAHIELREQTLDNLRKAALILDRAGKPVQIRAAALFDEIAPKLDDLATVRRRGEAREALAGDQRQRVLERRVLAPRDRVVLRALITVVDHRLDIGGDARHAPRANRFDAGLLDGVESGAAFRGGRRLAPVQRFIVAGDPERETVGAAARNRRVARGELARRLGQARLDALLVCDERRAVGGEAHLELGRFGHRPHRSGERALERLLRRFLGLAGAAVRGGGHGFGYRPTRAARKGKEPRRRRRAPLRSSAPFRDELQRAGINLAARLACLGGDHIRGVSQRMGAERRFEFGVDLLLPSGLRSRRGRRDQEHDLAPRRLLLRQRLRKICRASRAARSRRAW